MSSARSQARVARGLRACQRRRAGRRRRGTRRRCAVRPGASVRACSTLARSRSGLSRRAGRRTPARATSTRRATSGWSRPKGTATTGTPWASAFWVMPMPAWQTTHDGALQDGGVRDEALDADVVGGGEAVGVDLAGGDDDVVGRAGERLAGDLGEPAVVLEQRRARHEHERPVQVVEPGRRLRRAAPRGRGRRGGPCWASRCAGTRTARRCRPGWRRRRGRRRRSW